jgi:predicted phosphodiesterase
MTDPTPPERDPKVGPYLQNVGTDRIAISWIREGDERCILEYGPDGGDRSELTVGPRRQVKDTNDFIYSVRLTELLPGTRYVYLVRTPRGRHAATFRTLPSSPDGFTFIYYGDNKDGRDVHRRVASRFDRHQPLFVMHSGDMTNHGLYAEYAPLFFAPLREVIDRLPLFVGRGNHEGDGVAYRQVFDLPIGETWYSFDCGRAHFIVLDTTGWRHDTEKDDIRRMHEWLERDLAAAARATWKIAMYHEPSYDLGWRKDDWGLKDFLPLMRRGGVDLTLSGHAHGYQRLHPMIASGENERRPITHIISAGAGANIGHKPLDASPFLAADARRFNYLPITIAGERLVARVYSDDDDLLDEFELVKHAGEYDETFLRRALRAEEYPGRPIQPPSSI